MTKKTMIIVYSTALFMGLLFATMAGAVSGPIELPPSPGAVKILRAQDLSSDMRAGVDAQLSEARTHGYVTIDDKSVLTIKEASATGDLLSFEQLQKNTRFDVRQPGWLPPATVIIGGLPGGPDEKGPWNSVKVLYLCPEGEFSVEEWDMSDGAVTMVEETMNETVNELRATGQKSKLRQSGKDWYSLGWVSSGHYFSISGEIGPGLAKRIAESIK